MISVLIKRFGVYFGLPNSVRFRRATFLYTICIPTYRILYTSILYSIVLYSIGSDLRSSHREGWFQIKTIQNCKMIAEKNKNKISYTYKLSHGISEIKGGINVLSDLSYPKEIIDNTIEEK